MAMRSTQPQHSGSASGRIDKKPRRVGGAFSGTCLN
jgi:hypothetical protein